MRQSDLTSVGRWIGAILTDMKFRHLAVISIISIAVSTPAISFAAGLPTQIVPSDCNGTGGCQSICDVADLANNILNLVIFTAVFVAGVLFAWAGWKYVTAGGDTGKAAKAKQVFWNVTIGLVIILAAYLIVQTLMSSLSHIQGWNTLCNAHQ